MDTTNTMSETNEVQEQQQEQEQQPLEDLSQLFNKYKSDKDSCGYTALYHILFERYKYDPITMLEIGIGTMVSGAWSTMAGYAQPGYQPGASLRAWRDYFVNARIIGMDIQPDTQFEEDRIETYLCDTSNKDQVNNVLQQIDTKFDIILDDGSHNPDCQLRTLKHFYPYLKEKGIYIIEDIIHDSMLTYNPNLIKDVVGNDPIMFVGRKNNQCVIYKSPLVSRNSGC